MSEGRILCGMRLSPAHSQFQRESQEAHSKPSEPFLSIGQKEDAMGSAIAVFLWAHLHPLRALLSVPALALGFLFDHRQPVQRAGLGLFPVVSRRGPLAGW